jgi:ankyrin repeat protein
LHIAAQYGYNEIVQVLLTAKPNLSIRNHMGHDARECSLDAETYKLFEQVASAHEQYGRTQFNGQLLKNSRADHI